MKLFFPYHPRRLSSTQRTLRLSLAATLGGLALLSTMPRLAVAQSYVFNDLTPPFLAPDPYYTSAAPVLKDSGFNRAALLQVLGRGSAAETPLLSLYALLDLSGTSAVDLTPTFAPATNNARIDGNFGNLLFGITTTSVGAYKSRAVVWSGLSGALASDLTPEFLGADATSSVVSTFNLDVPRFVGVGAGPNTNNKGHAIYWVGPSKAAAIDIHPAFLSLNAEAYSDAATLTPKGVIFGRVRASASARSQAVLWTAPNRDAAVDMHPSFAGTGGSSEIIAQITETRFLGTWDVGDANYKPVLWTALSNASAQDLTPAFLGANSEAKAFRLTNSSLYGYGDGDATDDRQRALYWSSLSKESATDITPAFLGETASATIVAGGDFAGAATPLLFGEGLGQGSANHMRAVVWKGITAESAIDLTPSFLGEDLSSEIQSVQPAALTLGGPLVVGSGYGRATGLNQHALAWTGSVSTSAIDLHPTFVATQQGGRSFAEKSWGNVVTGYWYSQPVLGGSGFLVNQHAILWRGLNKSSAVDLHLQLPAAFRNEFVSSSVTGVDYDGNVFGAARYADNSQMRSWVLKPVGLTSRQVGAGADNRGRLLWNHSDGRVYLMSVNDANGALAPSVALTNVPGYTARAFTQGKVDGKTRLLLTTPTGAAKVQTIGANQTTLEATYTFSAPAGYRFTDISVGNDNKVRLLLSNVNGAAAVWRLGLTGAIELGTVYGPYQGYVPGGIATGTDNKTRIAYVYGKGARIAYHTLSATGSLEAGVVVSAPADYAFGDFTLGPDDKARVLWNAFSGGCAVWRMNAAGSAPETGKVFGPILGYAARGLAVSPDGTTRLMWKNYDRRTAYWTLDANLNVTKGYTFGPYN